MLVILLLCDFHIEYRANIIRGSRGVHSGYRAWAGYRTVFTVGFESMRGLLPYSNGCCFIARVSRRISGGFRSWCEVTWHSLGITPDFKGITQGFTLVIIATIASIVGITVDTAVGIGVDNHAPFAREFRYYVLFVFRGDDRGALSPE